MRQTQDLRLDFLGITPVYREENLALNPEQIVAFSALLTFKGKPIRQLYQEAITKEQDLAKKVKNILRKSTLKGHASMATTPHLCLTYQGSKFLDLLFTGINFSSSLVASGRRTAMEPEDIVVPTKIGKSNLKNLYLAESVRNIKFFNEMMQAGIPQDEASKIVQYGIFGTGIIALPLESVVNIKKELELEGDWLPEEAGLFVKIIEKKLSEYGVADLYWMRTVAPRDAYPYPHVFKDPKKLNIVRELRQKHPGTDSVITSAVVQPLPGLKRSLKELTQKTKKMTSAKKLIVQDWHELLNLRRQICRDYNLAVDLQILSSGSLRSYQDKKRHRTCYLICESIYYQVEKMLRVFKKIKISPDLTDKELKKIAEVFYLPPQVKSQKNLLLKWLRRGADSVLAYEKMTKAGIPPCEAIFIIPRAIRIESLQRFDLYNLISGYYPLRLCLTVDELLQLTTEKESQLVKKLLQKNLPELAAEVKVKCHLCGFCPEEKFCGKIKAAVPDYNEEFHQKMKKNLEQRYLKNCKF